MKTFSFILLLLLCINGPFPPLTGQVLLDIPYVAGGGHKQQLDLYLPEGKNFTMILYVHEGSLLSGDRKDEPYAQIARHFQKDGYGFALMSYRLGPHYEWPAQPDDVVSAVAWLKKNIPEYGGSGELFLLGHSSGAHLVSLVSTDKTYLQKKGLALGDIAGFVSMGTLQRFELDGWNEEALEREFKNNDFFRIFGDYQTFENAGAMEHINSTMPRCLLLIAEDEQINPPILAHSQEFVQKARQAGVEAAYFVIPDRTHMSAMRNLVEVEDPAYQKIVNFIESPMNNQSENIFLCRLTLYDHYQNPQNFTPEAMKTIEEHADYLHGLGRKGVLIAAGRTLFDPGDDRLFGIILLKAQAMEEVEAYRDGDPAYQKKIQRWEIFPFSMGIRYWENLEKSP